MVSIQAVVSSSGSEPTPTGPIVGAVFPNQQAIDAAGKLDDVPAYHPAFYVDPLPLPPRVNRPEPKLGRIVWPSWGLTRYAVGHLLMGPTDLAKLEAAPGYTGQVVLYLENADGTQYEIYMRILSRRPLNDPRQTSSTPIAPSDGQMVPWCVTLVDSRYDFASVLYQGIGSEAPDTWGELFTELAEQIGISLDGGYVDDYWGTDITPHPDWFGRAVMNGRPVSILLDAAAAQIGLRIMADNGNIFEALGSSDSYQDSLIWLRDYSGQAGAGGLINLSIEAPLTVDFSFASGDSESVAFGGDAGTISVDLQPTDYPATYASDYQDAMLAWFGNPILEAEFLGHVPSISYGANGGVFIHDTAENRTKIVRDPIWYPWPLAGYQQTAASQAASYYPTCDSSGSSGGISAGDSTCVVWYTNYLHIGSVSVQVGQSVSPGQQIGNVAVHNGGAHLHFALGDGDPLIFPGYVVPISGQSVSITTWLGLPVDGPHANCERGPMKTPDFTPAQLSYIESVFDSPVRGNGWQSVITSPQHCDYDYFAIDFTWPPIGGQTCAGQPVYNAVKSEDVLTTVESVMRHPVVGYAVLLRHQRACCFDPNDTTDPHIPDRRQFPGLPKSQIPQYPPSGIPNPYQPGSFNPVTRICMGFIPELTVVGNPFSYPTVPSYVSLDPTQFEIHNSYLRIKPALLVGASSGSSGSSGGEIGILPLTFEKTEVTVPAGMLVGKTTCTPPSTRCCDGPVDPCTNYDPVLPVVITGPFGVDCAEVTLMGEIAYDDGAWAYEGFINGESGVGAGIVANVQMDGGPGAWVIHVQFIGLGDDLLTDADIPVSVCGDGSILCGSAEVSRPTCMGLMTVQVGNPCYGSGSGGGSSSGSGSGSGSSGSGSVGTISTTCCPANLIASTLRITIDGDGGGTFLMTYDGVGNWDTGMVSLSGAGAGTITIRLYCFGTFWALQNNTGSPDYTIAFSGVISSSCSSFKLTYTGTLYGSGSYNGQTRNFTITF